MVQSGLVNDVTIATQTFVTSSLRDYYINYFLVNFELKKKN